MSLFLRFVHCTTKCIRQNTLVAGTTLASTAVVSDTTQADDPRSIGIGSGYLKDYVQVVVNGAATLRQLEAKYPIHYYPQEVLEHDRDTEWHRDEQRDIVETNLKLELLKSCIAQHPSVLNLCHRYLKQLIRDTYRLCSKDKA